MGVLVNEKNVVDEKALADAIIDGAQAKFLGPLEVMRRQSIDDLLTGLRSLLETHDIVISARPKT